MSHKHADAMALYAADAKKTDKPWELWEYRVRYPDMVGVWVDCLSNPVWDTSCEYRRRRVHVGKMEFPTPELELPPAGTTYFCPTIEYDDLHIAFTCTLSSYDAMVLKRGLIHLTEEAAIAHARALLSFTQS